MMVGHNTFKTITIDCYVPLHLACTDGDVRLVGGAVKTEGTVEVCLRSLWGAIAAEGWTATNAAVVCRQLRYPSEGIHAGRYA